MAEDIIRENQVWEGLCWPQEAPAPGAYDQCRFLRCDLSGAVLMGYQFTDCSFTECDLSNADLRGVVFNDTQFVGCKLLGLHFEDCYRVPFHVRFKDCNLTLASFVKMMLRKTQFEGCRMSETDLSGADLREAVFTGSDLDRAVFTGCNLEKADFRKALRFSIDPAVNRMRRAKFTLEGLPGLLSGYGLDIE